MVVRKEFGMLMPSPETVEIRKIVEALSEDDLRQKSASDIRPELEKAGLDYDAVWDRANNELARARKRRGIFKGRGRKVVLTNIHRLSDKQVEKHVASILREVSKVQERIGGLDALKKIVLEVKRWSEQLGMDGLLDLIQAMQEFESMQKDNE
jgi:hypothetical protein